MKQNPPQAKFAIVLVPLWIVVLLSSVACVRQSMMQTDTRPPGASTEGTRLDINTATIKELERLPGIGSVIAERIVEHRSQHGPFRRVEHVMMVRGISERKFRAIEALITVERTP